MQPHSRRRAVLALLFTTVLWGISFVTMRAMGMIHGQLAPQLDSWQFSCVSVTVRYALSTVVLFLIWRGRGGITRNEIAQGIAMGFFHGFGLLFQADGLVHTDASISAFLTQFYCVLLPVWAALRQRKLPNTRTAVSVVMIMAGIALLAQIDWRNFRIGRGELETLLASIFFTAQILWLEKPVYRGNRTSQITITMFATVAVLLAPFAACQTADTKLIARLFAPASIWILMAILVVFSTVCATLMMNKWQHHVTATEAGLIYGTEPVYAFLFALFLPALFSQWFHISYPNETTTLRLLLGGSLIFGANALMQWRREPSQT